MTDLAGIHMVSNNSSEWDFRGVIISSEQYSSDFDADIAAVLVEDCLTPATRRGGQHNSLESGPTSLPSFDHSLPDSTPVTRSYADTDGSIRPNYNASSGESRSQHSAFIPTPTTSASEEGNVYALGQSDSVEQQKQRSVYPEPPPHTCGSTALESWYSEPERHELIAYNLSEPSADPTPQKELKEICRQKSFIAQAMNYLDEAEDTEGFLHVNGLIGTVSLHYLPVE